MKILMIAPEPFFEPRGTPISVYQRLYALSALGHQVDLLTYHVGQDVDIPGVTIHRLPNVPIIKDVKIGPSWPKAFLDVLLICQAIVLLAANRYDVIHSHEEAAFFSAPLAILFRTRHLYDMHSSLPRQLANSGKWGFRPLVKLFRILERWVLYTCDATITVGADLEQRVLRRNPRVEQTRIENTVLYPYDDASHASARVLKERLGLNGKLPIVYTGTFESYQGLDLLFGSATIVKRHYPDVLFVLAGGKPKQLEHWQAETRKLGLEDCTLFLGIVSPAEALACLEIAEILVSPRTEGTSVPLKTYSYLNSGKPIVATNLMAHTQVLNEDTALLVAPTEEALADGILRLIRSPDLRQELGQRAQEYAREKYGSSDYLAKVDRVYQALEPATPVSEPATPAHQSAPTSPQKQSAPVPSLKTKS
jgi:glycosyltransferase involved in cell wall biosynthesis